MNHAFSKTSKKTLRLNTTSLVLYDRQTRVRASEFPVTSSLPIPNAAQTNLNTRRLQKKTVDGRSTSSHDNKKFRTRSVEKQRRMLFGFRKTATAVKNRTDRQMIDR